MSEINCLVLLNNPEKEILLNMDTQVTYSMFNDEVRKTLQIDIDLPIQFSYFDSEGDRVLFNSEEEFKELLNYAATLDMMTIFAHSSEASDESSDSSDSSPNIIPIQEKQENDQSPLEAPSIEEESDIKPLEENEVKGYSPRFNIKYQIPLQRKPTPIIYPNTVRNEPQSEENKINEATQPKVMCDNCNEEISNVRYKCLDCYNFDLCEKCEESKCKSGNQIHPSSHIFAKIPEPVYRPELSPFVHFPQNNPRFGPPCAQPVHPLAQQHHRCKKAEKTKARKERRNEKREEKKGAFQLRGEKITELESRIQSLEQQLSSIRLPPTSSSNNNNNDNSNIIVDNLGDSYDRKFWPFQC